MLGRGQQWVCPCFPAFSLINNKQKSIPDHLENSNLFPHFYRGQHQFCWFFHEDHLGLLLAISYTLLLILQRTKWKQWKWRKTRMGRRMGKMMGKIPNQFSGEQVLWHTLFAYKVKTTILNRGDPLDHHRDEFIELKLVYQISREDQTRERQLCSRSACIWTDSGKRCS